MGADSTNQSLCIGLIADTHGLMRPEALAALAGCDHVIHAGDIGKPDVLLQLERIAPLSAIRGNIDTAPWAQALPEQRIVTFGRLNVYVLHDLKTLDLDPLREGLSVVVSGHSHKSMISERDGVLYVNPGSAGPRRFKLPISVARLVLGEGRASAELVELAIS